uniref:GTP-binding protein 2 n=1 Tax=Mycena chlorophos TaxID=658473 RepID=A0ABQ0M4Z2_MYCCL|nr:predicted protein [Mycena chlorophos]
MFAENESESPRVPSPWDPFISTPPSPSPSPIPRLVPEQDDGNVEYKLQLLSPSPGRFARLVTQMKWRLLEGGGQAYYELGVADSGILVGLPRAELEASLETLEMMAGEIGASVIVVKEIERTAALATYFGRLDGHKHRDGAVCDRCRRRRGGQCESSRRRQHLPYGRPRLGRSFRPLRPRNCVGVQAASDARAFADACSTDGQEESRQGQKSEAYP